LQSLEALLMLDASDTGAYVPPTYEELVPRLHELSRRAACRYFAAASSKLSFTALFETLAEGEALPCTYAFLLAHWRECGWPPRAPTIDKLIRAATVALCLEEPALAAALLTEAGVNGFAQYNRAYESECVPVHSVLVRALSNNVSTPALEAFLAALLASEHADVSAHRDTMSVILFGASSERVLHKAALLACVARGVSLVCTFVASIRFSPIARGIKYLREGQCLVNTALAFALVNAALSGGNTPLARALLTRPDTNVVPGFGGGMLSPPENGRNVSAADYDSVADVMPANVARTLATSRPDALLGRGEACTAARVCRYLERFARDAGHTDSEHFIYAALSHLARAAPLAVLDEALAWLATHEPRATTRLLAGTAWFMRESTHAKPVYVRAHAALLVAAVRANVAPAAFDVFTASLELVDAVLERGAPPPVLERAAACLVRCVAASCCLRAHAVDATTGESVHMIHECVAAAHRQLPDADAAERLRASHALLDAGLPYDAFLLAFPDADSFKSQVEGVGSRPLHTVAGALRLWTWEPALAAAHGHVLDARLLHEMLLEHEQRRERAVHAGLARNARRVLARSLRLLARPDIVLAPSAGAAGDLFTQAVPVLTRAGWDECAANLHADLQPALATLRDRLFAE